MMNHLHTTPRAHLFLSRVAWLQENQNSYVKKAFSTIFPLLLLFLYRTLGRLQVVTTSVDQKVVQSDT